MEDSEPWVSVVANILKVFPESGSLTTEVDERHQYFHELIADLRKSSKGVVAEKYITIRLIFYMLGFCSIVVILLIIDSDNWQLCM